jgi:pimeloyl-ACP methyl ester carboxylesterase
MTLGGCGFGKIGGPAEIEGVDNEVYRVSLERGEFDVTFARVGSEDDRRVILVHGTPGSLGAWSRYLREPIEGVELVAIDRPGFGGSEPRRAVCELEDQARAIAPLLVERNGEWPVLVGHSLGGPIIARVAADYPDRVGALVILAGSLDPGLEKPRWFNYAGALPLLDLALPRSLRHANKEIMAARRETQALEPLLESVTCPVVIVHGMLDTLVPFDNVAYMRERFTSSDKVIVVELEREGHFLPWRQEWLVRRLIERMALEDTNGQ